MTLNLFSLAPNFQLLPVQASAEILGPQPFLLPLLEFPDKVLFPGWGQGQHCSGAQKELRGDILQKLHLMLTYILE